MATLIPAFYSCSGKMTSGERRFAQRLEDKLDSDYLLWYDVPVGPKKRHPDFIILHPEQGLFVLEVKDWKLENIQSVTHTEVTLLTEQGIKTLKNPLVQARDCALEVNQLLEKDSRLVQPEGKYQGKLVCPYSYGVVFSNITRKAFNQIPALQEVLDAQLVICKDEFVPSVNPDDFQVQLGAMGHYEFGERLSKEQIDCIRWHIFPELRITEQQLELLDLEESQGIQKIQPSSPDLMRILDLQQEQLARSLGDGHRVVHGVAGSGKTLILAYRAQYLAETTKKPVLVLCFNVSLAAHIKNMIEVRKEHSGPPVLVRHFHGWCSDLLKAYRVGLPNRQQYSGSKYIEQLVKRVINAVSEGKIPSGLYGAVMIDEGHDFEASWFELVTKMVTPETNSLLVLYDDAQNLYGKRQKRQFSFKSVGIQARGRTTVLRINYRNPVEVLNLACVFVEEAIEPTATAQNEHPKLTPETAGRSGAVPELVMLPSFGREAVYLAERVEQFYEKGIPWSQIAIVYRTKFMGEVLNRQLTQAGIPVEWISKNSNSRFYNPNAQSVKLLTMHSSKGLEFEAVCIPGIGYLPNSHGDKESEMRLFYVAMTRATDRLLLTAHQPSEYVERLRAGLQATA
ncbi:MAG: 3'-5' exonuclease [Cyanobacteria bacterium P01_F01_bin.53]